MKYAQGIMGLLIGTALGGVIGSNATGTMGADKDGIREVVREVIKEEPQLIMESVAGWQQKQQQEKVEASSSALKDPAFKAKILDTKDSPFIGDGNSTRTVVEFFDYNCPACKMQYQELGKLFEKDPNVKIIFKEYPIFGEQSETNSKIGIAVHRLYSDKYFSWHGKMMSNQGRTDEAAALKFANELGMDTAQLKTEAATPEVAAILANERELGHKLSIQGTPTLIVGDELVPHAMQADQLIEKLGK